MSTFAPDPVVLVASVVAILIWLRARQRHQPAMRVVRLVRGRRTITTVVDATPTWCAVANDVDASRSGRPAVGIGRMRALAHEAFGLRPPAGAEYGDSARIGALRRIRSVVLLAVLLVCNGVLVAAGLGLLAFLGGFFLEQAIN